MATWIKYFLETLGNTLKDEMSSSKCDIVKRKYEVVASFRFPRAGAHPYTQVKKISNIEVLKDNSIAIFTCVDTGF